MRVASRVVEMGVPVVARQLLKGGAPVSQRPHLWEVAMSVEPEPQLYQKLQESTQQWDFVTDDLVHLDVQSTAMDASYFPFEEHLDSMLLTLSRDEEIAELMVTASVDKPGQPATAPFPPSGVVPFRGLVFYVAPFSYLFEGPEKMYMCFRKLFCEQLCRLQNISSDSRDILGLAKQFETLLMEVNPALFFHLNSIEVEPLSVAFSWIFYGFCGYLENDQVLCLWDRLVGFGDLVLFPVLAVAIFHFRSQALLEATTSAAVDEIFEDTSRLNVVALLQQFLFL